MTQKTVTDRPSKTVWLVRHAQATHNKTTTDDAFMLMGVLRMRRMSSLAALLMLS